jgi:benzoyl-CoA reductase subunit A
VRVAVGIDLGSTTTKAILLDEDAQVLGRGITNSRSNYQLAADIARDEAFLGARFTLLERALAEVEPDAARAAEAHRHVVIRFRRHQHLAQLARLRQTAGELAQAAPLRARLDQLFDRIEAAARRRLLAPSGSEFFRDLASSEFSRAADELGDAEVPFDQLMSVFDKAILVVENTRTDVVAATAIRAAIADLAPAGDSVRAAAWGGACERALAEDIEVVATIGTGYGRQRLPFAKEMIRSEILCHGLGAHAMFPATATVLDIGGQDTKAIQVDDRGIVTSFQMNDRCAAGCGRYLGYIADEMSLGVHELGPMAMQSTRQVKITSTCTVFAGAELRDRLTMGQKREDILAGLHRAIILRAMALLARSGGVRDQFTFTGGVANNEAAVAALRQLVAENYGERAINISAGSIYTGALGAALFAHRTAAGVEEVAA